MYDKTANRRKNESSDSTWRKRVIYIQMKKDFLRVPTYKVLNSEVEQLTVNPIKYK